MSASVKTNQNGLEKHSYDVLIIGAGGAGLRAAISAHEAGLRVAII
jgi:succinate dehydrogenase / fumarate reductase flavoprotein subunit